MLTERRRSHQLLPEGVLAPPQRQCEELGHSGVTQSRAVTPPHGKEPVKMVQASDQDASWMPPR